MNDAVALQLLATMPMRFAGLVLENTNRCNAKCGMCYQSSGPKGSDVLGQSHLQFEVMSRLIREARDIPTLTPRFHLAGGEAFMHMDECIALYMIAKDAGYLDLTGTTNAFWARSLWSARKTANQLREAGVTSLEISWDIWHAPYVAAESVGRAIRACFEAGIECNLRLLTTRSHDLTEALRDVPGDDLALANRMTSGPVFATGRASLTIPAEDFHESGGGLGGACHPSLNLTVNALGRVSPCCAGFDQTDQYNFGNVREESIVAIAERMNADPIARVLVFLGVSKLLPILERAGVHLEGDFKGICQMCWTVFSSAACVKVLREHVSLANERSFTRLAQSVAWEDAQHA